MDLLELEALVASARRGQSVLPHLPLLLATVRDLLKDIKAVGGEEAAQAARKHRLLLAFRAARNAAATGGPPAIAVLLHEGLLDAVCTSLALISDATIALDWQLPAAVAQTLANLCTASSDGAAAAWGALFPLQLTMLAHVNAGATQAATCLTLLACCRRVDGAAAALSGPSGSQAMTALLCNHQRQLQQGEHNDNLGLLAAHLAFHHNLLPVLFDSLSESSGEERKQPGSGLALGSSASRHTMAQVALLELLCAEAHEMMQLEPLPAPAARQPPSNANPGAAAQFLVQLAQQLTAGSKAAPLSAGQQQVLQASLHLQRDLCARDDSGAGLSGGRNLASELQAAGVLPSTLAMLKALEPIRPPQHAAAAADDAALSSTGSSSNAPSGCFPVAQLAPQLAARATAFPAAPPYPGFRSDLLSVVANAAHGRPSVQAEVQQLGGVELVLAQCQLDRNSPLAREWALWAVRNLCEGNSAAQEAIRELQLCTTVDSVELQQLGVKLELDEQTGKLRVTKRNSGADRTPT